MGKQKEAVTLEEQNKNTAMRVSVVSIVWNVVLSLFKLIAGIVGHSGAMISDAVHSASDVFSTFVVILGVNIASRQSDEDHQYGHDRLECVAAIILAVVLFATGIGIGIGGVNKILGRDFGNTEIPGMIALAAAVVSIGVKEAMFWYTRAAAKKINSGALMADAWHHRSDALSSVGAFVGILGARMGFPVLDPLASVVICIFIAKAAYDIFKDAIDKMVDKSCDEETERAMREVILKQAGVQRVDMLHTRLFGARIYVDIEISADGEMTLREGHEIAQEVHDRIEEEFPLVKHCMVHVNPV
ncbi:cation diffusion facilitator family transporter [Blautia argi]|uniref:Cation-efflux pump n=1 Tax=Blautia argi TaxID=1912897 RepID=A0A2Z4UDL8_9FIRM|nr:cation diffusion facilitator family transporter [Blautia argi]AWY99058.1 cation-efflux pump [Blautia argi]